MGSIFWLVSLLAAFFRCAITTVKGNPDPASMANDPAGAMVTPAVFIPMIQALQQNGAPAFGNWTSVLIPQTLTARTYTAGEIVGGLIRRFAPAVGATTDCTDTATNIVSAIPGAKVGQTWLSFIANMGSTALTLAAGTGVTIAGTALIQSNSLGVWLGQVTGSAAVTFSHQFNIPLGSQSPLAAAQ